MDGENRSHGEMLMARWRDFRDATHAVLEAAGYRSGDRVPALRAFAVALVAETVGGTPDPCSPEPFSYSVLGPRGERILVWVTDAETQGLEGGLVMRFDEENWDRIAFVVFQNLEPQAIHLMDAACFRRVRTHLATAVVGPVRSFAGEDEMCLSVMLHMNIAMEPLVAEVLGVESVWLTERGP